MAELFLKGLATGLTLSFMIGPLLFAIVQASLERGFRAGIAVGAGIWVSDVIFVVALYFSMDWVAALTSAEGFKFYAGLVGGAVLLFFGLGSLLFTHKNKSFEELGKKGIDLRTQGDKVLDKLDGKEAEAVQQNWKTWGNWGYFLRGFFLNLFNPGTIFFWIGIASALVVPNDWSASQITVFFGSMLSILVLTDTLKAYAAKRIKGYLTEGQIFKTQTAIGLILMGIGAFVLWETLL